jgi:NADH dehydrogenase FAD-containing subunit
LVSSIKSTVDSEFPDRVLHSFEKITAGFPKITFKQASLEAVNTDNTIEIKLLPTAQVETLAFDQLILCTGFSYDQPVKDQNSMTLADRKQSMKDFYDKIAAAKSVLVAGGGVVGVELAGEFAIKYASTGNKKIGICTKGDRLLSGIPAKGGQLAEAFLKNHKVEVYTKTPYGESTARELGYDLVIQCMGYKFHTEFLRKNYGSALAPNGQIYVNDLFQISGVNPRVNGLAPGLRENVFAFGDVTQTSLNETKGVIAIKNLAQYLQMNLVQIAHGQKPSHTIPDSIPHMEMISLGPEYAVLNINGLVTADPHAAKKKFELTDEYE